MSQPADIVVIVYDTSQDIDVLKTLSAILFVTLKLSGGC